jgi:UDP-2,3-diacylglucosamine hydrolase
LRILEEASADRTNPASRGSLSATRQAFVKKLGLIAGNGKLPLIFAEQARKEGYSLVAVAHHGETLKEIESLIEDVTWIYVGQLGKIIRTFLRAGISEAVMVGGIRKVKFLENFRPDLRGAKFLARLKRKDDDALLRGVAEELGREGITVVESTVCLSEIVPAKGVLTKRSPTVTEWEDVRFGFRVAKEVGRLGVGQTVVVKRQVVVAVEALEGTDAAIERGGALAKSAFVVVKASKPQQDLRFDVPAVGIDTITRLHRAGGAVLAIEADKTLLLEKEALLKEADRFGICVVAVGDN